MKKYVVDVCIPTYRPGQEFRELLLGLLKQNYPIRRICIVNTGSAFWDRSFEELSSRIQVRHILPGEFDHGGTRAEMAERSNADLLLFMTQDAVPADERLVERMAAHFSLPEVKAVYARQLPKPDCRTLERFTRNFNYPEESDIRDASDVEWMGIKAFFCSDVCAMYERRTYLELGGFVRRTLFNEDMIYAGTLIRAGYSVAYAADAAVLHSHNYSLTQLFRRNFDLGASQTMYEEFFRAYPSEGEGLRLVKAAAEHVLSLRKPWLLVPLVFQSAAKYAGYLLGKRFRMLPAGVILRCTSFPVWWKYHGEEIFADR